MEVHHLDSKESAKSSATDSLNTILSGYYSEGLPVLLLLSGGSALELVKELDLDNNLTTMTMLDERYSTDPKINNFLQALEKFKEVDKEDDLETIDTIPEEEDSLTNFAVRFERHLRQWLDKNEGGKLVATMGIGTDGHTAGLMPMPEDPDKFNDMFNKPDKWVIGYTTDKSEFTERVTTTIPFLEKLDDVIVYITDKNKKQQAWEKIEAEEGSLAEVPGRLLRDLPGNVQVFLDF